MKYNSVEEWKAEATRRFGPDMLKWRFRCPMCGHVASVQDFKDAERNLRTAPIRSVWAGTPARARRRRVTAAAVTGRPTGCSASLLSMTSLSWLPAIKWTCTRSRTESRRLTMAEYHVGCGAFAIYAGTLNSRNKNLWQNKTECTDEAICAVRDYIVQECLGGLNCEKATSGGYEWTLKDGRVVELRVTVKDGGKQ